MLGLVRELRHRDRRLKQPGERRLGEPDPERERELVAAVREVEGVTTMTPVLSHGKITDVVAVDERVKAQYRGAQGALAEREEELRAYARDHFEELVAEGLDRAAEVRETCRVALERALEAEGLWRREASARAELARLAGREDELLARPLTDPFGLLPAPSTADLAPVPPALRR